MKKILYTTLRTGKKIYVTPNQMGMIKRREKRLRRIEVNRHQRRKLKSKKGGKYYGLTRPSHNGRMNGGKKRYG